MTTVAYRDGIMAADSMLSDYRDIKRKTKKIWIFPGHSVIGTAGDDQAILPFLDWWEAGADRDHPPKLGKYDLHCIIVYKNGKVEIWDETLIEEEIDDPFCAVGSGRGIAYGRMEGGGTAEEAVLAACKWNTETNEPVIVCDVMKELGVKRRKGRK